MRAAVVGRALQLSPSIARLILTTKYDSGFPNELTSGVWPSSASATNPPHAKTTLQAALQGRVLSTEGRKRSRVPSARNSDSCTSRGPRPARGTSQFQLRGAM